VTVYDGYVYTPSDSLWCLDALTGERIWAFGGANHSGGSPVVINNSVYCAEIGMDSTCVYQLSASTGEVQWSQVITGETKSCMSLWNNMLVVPTWLPNKHAPLTALDSATGEIIWENYESFRGYWDSSPVIVDDVIYITAFGGSIMAVDAATGVTVWKVNVSDWPTESTMSYHDGLLYSACGCIETTAGNLIWESPQYTYQHGSSGIAGGLCSFCEGMPDTSSFIALNCSDGTEAWHYRVACGYLGLISSPSIVDGVMYAAGTDWNLYAFGTGLKYTYRSEPLNSHVGWNELIASSYCNGEAVASDTISYYINSTGIEFEPSILLELSCYPNPFSSSASISFSLSESGFTRIGIYDLTGRCVSSLVEDDLAEGSHTLNWDGTGQYGQKISSGLYLCAEYSQVE